MRVHGIARLPLVLAATAALALPGAAVAVEAAPPLPVVSWQTHLAHMQAMDGALGAHVTDCIAMHGSMADQLGPKGAMVEMMGEMVLLR